MSKTVMIVDDQEFIRTILKARLEAIEGVLLSEASNGDEAIMDAITYKPDLILLDIVMPKIDGLTILSALKDKEETKHIPIVIVSSHADQWKIDKALELGAEEFIDKAELKDVDFPALVEKYTS